MYFKDGNLKAYQSSTVAPAHLKVAGKPGSMTVDEAKRIVAEQLGFTKATVDSIHECREGVYLPDDDPTKAMVAFRVCIPAGAKHEPIHVFVDPEKKQVLRVK